MAGLQVAFDCWADREVREDVAVVGDEGFGADPCFDGFDPSARVEKNGFVAVFHRHSAILIAFQKLTIRLGAVVGVDDK